MEERGLKIFAPSGDPRKDDEVFYNPEMLENRDLSFVAAKTFLQHVDIEDPNIADPLTGTGIRGLRYSELGEVYLNDANPNAVEAAEKALKENSVEASVENKDANVFLSEKPGYFHFIDIDPYGPFTPFLDSTARSANYNSFVGLTATDNSAPTGSYPKVCERRYSSKPLKNSFMHETALRIYIKEAFQNFARYDKAFEPKFCYQHKHYTRIMGRVTESKKRTNKALENIGYLSYCDKCGWRKLQRVEKCGYCGGEVEYAGPLWTGKIADSRFTEKMLENISEEWEASKKILEKVHAESEILTPFYDLHELASRHDVPVPKRDKVIEALKEKGYPVSRTHFGPTGIRTDAPLEDILEFMM
ncbi:MAG: tRNA (guanine(10)-N(2))-dimethyltransferase [Candidatus Nanohaloarchaea archaeon]